MHEESHEFMRLAAAVLCPLYLPCQITDRGGLFASDVTLLSGDWLEKRLN